MNAFTVDVEDYYQVTGFENSIAREEWETFESRVEKNTLRILDILDEHRTEGTFFVLGWVARRHQDLVREIHRRGHEVGCHSYWHRLVYRQTPDDFRDDLRRSRDILEEIIQQPVISYRAPSFSITRQSLWALDILAEEGFRIDSSVFPVRHDRYGIAAAKPYPHHLATDQGRTLWEFPPTVYPWPFGPQAAEPSALGRLPKFNLPVSGGGYFRLYPLRLSQFCLNRINRKYNRPFMFYIHPWEIDPHQPRLCAGSRLSRFRHYINLSKTEAKLRRILELFRFKRLSRLLKETNSFSEVLRIDVKAERVT